MNTITPMPDRLPDCIPAPAEYCPVSPDVGETDFNLYVEESQTLVRPAPVPAPARRWPWVAAVAVLVAGGGLALALVATLGEDDRPRGGPVAQPPAPQPASPLPGVQPVGKSPGPQLALLQPAAWVQKLTERVESVAFSPDGKYVLSGGRDRAVRLWDAATGAAVREFSGHQNGVTAVAFSPDGRRALSVGGSQVFIWEVASGKRTHAFTHPDGRAVSGTFSPDGRLILVAAGKVAFSPDSLVAFSHEKSAAVQCWDLESGRALDLDHHKGGGGYGGSPQFQNPYTDPYLGRSSQPWDLKTGRRLDERARPFAGVSGNGRFRIIAKYLPSHRLGLEVWDVTKPNEGLTFGEEAEGPMAMTVSNDGTRAAAVYNDNAILIWNIAKGVRHQSLRGHEAQVFALAFSPDGRALASGGWDGTVRVWPLRD